MTLLKNEQMEKQKLLDTIEHYKVGRSKKSLEYIYLYTFPFMCNTA